MKIYRCQRQWKRCSSSVWKRLPRTGNSSSILLTCRWSNSRRTLVSKSLATQRVAATNQFRLNLRRELVRQWIRKSGSYRKKTKALTMMMMTFLVGTKKQKKSLMKTLDKEWGRGTLTRFPSLKLSWVCKRSWERSSLSCKNSTQIKLSRRHWEVVASKTWTTCKREIAMISTVTMTNINQMTTASWQAKTSIKILPRRLQIIKLKLQTLPSSQPRHFLNL